jgi:hypothetical protein
MIRNPNSHYVTDQQCLLVLKLPAHLTITMLKADNVTVCCLCKGQFKPHDMRNHGGKHVLFAMLDINENVSLRLGARVCILYLHLKDWLLQHVTCGFCGLDRCAVQLTKKENSTAIASSCIYHYKAMTYRMAVKCTKNTPCTNVPIHSILRPSHNTTS